MDLDHNDASEAASNRIFKSCFVSAFPTAFLFHILVFLTWCLAKDLAPLDILSSQFDLDCLQF